MTTRILYNRLIWVGSLAIAILIVGAVTLPVALAVGVRLARLILGGG